MRAQDKIVFAQAARKFKAWILVRRTNPDSLPYIGRPGYVPKRIDCKAKTADKNVGSRRWAGLVVDPFLCPTAFSATRLLKATETWHEFAAAQHLGKPSSNSPYAVETASDSPHFGCVTFQGNYIHGDYDLYDIILANHPSANLAAVEMLHGQPHRRGPLLNPIMSYVEEQIHVPMIQHGGEAQYTHSSEQSIDVFGPEGEEFTILNEFSVTAWYRDVWKREHLGVKPKTPNA